MKASLPGLPDKSSTQALGYHGHRPHISKSAQLESAEYCIPWSVGYQFHITDFYKYMYHTAVYCKYDWGKLERAPH